MLTVIFRGFVACDGVTEFWCSEFSGSEDGYNWGPKDGAWLCLSAIIVSLLTSIASIIVECSVKKYVVSIFFN
jgi:hypothetical protein